MFKLLASLPYLRLLAVCNSLAYNNSRPESDIDLFIITSPGKIWTARFFAVSLLKLLRLQPQPQKTQDQICLTFWVTADRLNLQRATLGAADIYFQYWLATLWPLYDAGNFYLQLVAANGWLKEYLPQWQGKLPPPRRRIKLGLFAHYFKLFGEKLLAPSWVEGKLKKFQLKILPPKLKEMMNKDTKVMVDDWMLKFHDNDRREEYRREYERRLRDYEKTAKS